MRPTLPVRDRKPQTCLPSRFVGGICGLRLHKGAANASVRDTRQKRRRSCCGERTPCSSLRNGTKPPVICNPKNVPQTTVAWIPHARKQPNFRNSWLIYASGGSGAGERWRAWLSRMRCHEMRRVAFCVALVREQRRGACQVARVQHPFRRTPLTKVFSKSAVQSRTHSERQVSTFSVVAWFFRPRPFVIVLTFQIPPRGPRGSFNAYFMDFPLVYRSTLTRTRKRRRGWERRWAAPPKKEIYILV